ncbi:hypothetical protein HBI67_080350 [Parastagonospora nodorum]|nr:hypothetical protein HBI09_034840 [Parastagonospora nodorum]KAH6071733.1 hypothetical protein HBI67_080350 [Parastagonospora nodorum]KAH6225703.1 hypothetical protein HBI15_097210 [Parastagonospora nodorum]
MPELIAEGRAWVGHETTVELIPDRCQVVWVRLRIDGVMEDEVLSYVNVPSSPAASAELVLDTSKLTTAISAKIESTPDVDVIKSLKPLRVPWHLTADPTEQLGEDVELTLRWTDASDWCSLRRIQGERHWP